MASQLPAETEAMAQRLVETLRGEATRFVTAERLPDIRLESAAITTVVDPANGLPGYEGVWRNHLGERVGKLIFNSDGSFYAEFDICVRHPSKSGWFVEAVTVWGKGNTLKAEARLLPMI